MTEQVQEVQQDEEQDQEEQLSQAEAEESAAFAASFGEVRGDEPHADQGDDAEQSAAGAEAAEQEGDSQEEQAGEAQQQEPEQIVFAGLTESQLAEKLAKIDVIEQMSSAETAKLHGKIGELNGTLKELQRNGNNRAAMKVAKDQFKRLSEDYPEIAEMLAEDLSGLDFAGGGGGLSEDVVEQRVTERVSEVKEELSREMQMNLLKIQHRDYVDVYASDQFRTWLQSQPKEEQEKIENSWDAVYLSEKLTEFKSWRNEKQNTSAQRQQRLRNAIPPKTTQGAVKAGPASEEDGFNSVFKK